MADNLAIPQVASNQNQKEVTINDATAKLSGALTDAVDLDLTSGNVTVSNTNFQSNIKFNAINNTVSRSITVPAIQRELFIVENKGSATLSIIRGSTTLTLASGSKGLYATDGTTNGLFKLTSGGEQDYVYSVGGKPPASMIVPIPFAAAVRLLTGLPGSQFYIDTNPTATMTFTLYKNAGSIGTVAFATDGTPTVTFSGDVSFAIGDKLRIEAPGSPDATGAGIGMNFKVLL